MADHKDTKTAQPENSSVLSTTFSLGEEKKTTAESAQTQAGTASSFSLTTPKGTKFDVKTLRDVVNEVPPEREWTVEGIAPDSGLGIIGGRHWVCTSAEAWRRENLSSTEKHERPLSCT